MADGELIFNTKIDNTAFQKGLDELKSAAESGVAAVGENAKKSATEIGNAARTGLTQAANSAKETFGEMGQMAADGLKDVGDAVKTGLNNATKPIDAFGDDVAKGMDGAEKAVKEFGDTVQEELDGVKKDFDGVEKSTDGFGDGFEKGADQAAKATGSMATEFDGLKVKLASLKSEYAESKKTVDDLTQALQKSAKEKGSDAAETKNLIRALDDAKKSQKELEASIHDTAEESKEFKGTFSGLTDAAADAGKSFAAVSAALVGLVEGTEDFRKAMSKLEQNGKNAGVSMELLEGEMKSLYAITGDTDTSVEALSNLLMADLKGNNLKVAVEELSGAIVAFPDTLTIESLADGLQETLATGNAVGQYGELLERLGVNLDEVNARMAEATTETEKQEIALSYLSQNGLSKAAAEYRSANKDQIAYKEAQFDLQKSTSELAKKALPILAKGTQFLADNMDKLVPLIGAAVAAYGAYKIASAAAMIAQEGLNIAMAANPIGMVITGITALVAGIAAVTAGIMMNRSEADQLVDSINEVREARQADIEKAQQEGDNTVALASRLSGLVDANGRVIGSKERVKALVDGLNESIPNLALAYDEETNSINMTADAVMNLAKQEAARALLEAKKEAFIAAVKAEEEATQQLAESKKDLAEAEREAADAAAGMTEHMLSNGANSGLDMGVAKAREEVERLTASISESQAVQAEYISAAENPGNAFSVLQNGLYSTADAYDDVADAAEKSIELQVDYFSKGEEKIKTSATKILQTLGKQKEYYTEYNNNLQYLLEKGGEIPAELWTKLLEGGSESVTLAGVLVEELKKKNRGLYDELIAGSAAAQDAANATEDTITDITNNFKSAAEQEEKIGKAITNMFDGLPEAVKSATSTAKVQGKAVPVTIAEAIAAGKPAVDTSTKNMMGGILPAVLDYAKNAGTQGKQVPANVSSGITGGSGAVSTASKTMMAGAKKSADGETASFLPVGQSAAQKTGEGINKSAGIVDDAAKTSVVHAKGAADTAAQQFTEVGSSVSSWFSKGTASSTSVATGAITKAFQALHNTAMASNLQFVEVGKAGIANLVKGMNANRVAAILTIVNIQAGLVNVAKSSSASWNGVGVNIVQGIASGMRSQTFSLSITMRNIVSSAVSAAKAAAGIHSPSKLFEEEVGLQMGLGIALGLEDSEDANIKAAQEVAEKGLSAAQKWVEDQKLLGNLSLADEAEVWDQVAKHYINGTRQQIQAEQNAADIRDTLAKNSFEYSKKWISDRKKYDQLSLAEELAAWERVAARYADGTDERAEAEEELYSLRKEIYDQTKEIYDDFVEYQKDKYAEIDDLEQEYQNSVKSRADAIMGEFGLFDAVTQKSYVTSGELIRKLQGQVSATESFYTKLNELAERGVNTDMVEEIKSMGVDASAELDAILRMTDDQLQKYSDLYGEKQGFATQQALEELKPLREETSEKISEILSDVDTKFAEAQEVGMALTDGIATGILEGSSAVVSAAMQVANDAITAMKKELQIESPSKRMKNEIGLMAAYGIGDGFSSGSEYIRASAVESLQSAVSAMKSGLISGTAQPVKAATVSTTNINKTVTQNGTIRLSGKLSDLAELLWEPLQEYGRIQGEVY